MCLAKKKKAKNNCNSASNQVQSHHNKLSSDKMLIRILNDLKSVNNQLNKTNNHGKSSYFKPANNQIK